MNILFDNNTDTFIDTSLIESVINEVLVYEKVNNNCEISVTIVNNAEIQQINLKHRGIDNPTDVLSFPLIDFNKESYPLTDKIYLGDIVLSIEKAYEQAKEYNHSINREIGFLIAHSMLHLLGYDHIDKNDEVIMFTKQEDILSNLNLKR